jgi:hypothetical protein
MRFRLRTLLIVLALGPMVFAGAWFAWQDWRARQAKAEQDRLAIEAINRWYLSALADDGSWRPLYEPDSDNQTSSPMP